MMAEQWLDYQTTPTGPAQDVPTARDVPLEDQVLEVFSPSPVPTCSTSSPLDTILTDLPDLDYFSCKTPDIIPPSCPMMNTQPVSNDLSAQVYGSPEFVIHDVDSSYQEIDQYINDDFLALYEENISLQQNMDSSVACVDVSPPPQQTIQHQYLPQYPQVPGNHLVPLGDQANGYQHLDQQQQMFQNYLVLVNQHLVVMDQHQTLGHCPQPKVPPLYHHGQSSGQHMPHHYNVPSHQVQPRQLMSFSLSPGQRKEEMEKMKQFAQKFKTKHEGLGYTSEGLSQQLQIRYGVDISGDTIAKFEAGQLDLQGMHALKCYMEWWLLDIVRAQGGDIETIKQLSKELSPHQMVNKKRTCIQKEQKELLEAEFGRNSRPSAKQLEEIAARLFMDKNVVRVWFCNKRQKVKRQAAM